jgi:hypothetical protein
VAKERGDADGEQCGGDTRVDVVGQRFSASVMRSLSAGVRDLVALEEIRPTWGESQSARRSPEQTRFIQTMPPSSIPAYAVCS